VFSVTTLQTEHMSVARTARERVHEEVSGEILAVARTHLARDGGSALSLRSVARELGMAPSALYRYYPGRDALLSALILSAYNALADEAERAADQAARSKDADATRWLAVPRAMRRWAIAHPHEWGLIFGTPVPGYEAPQETVVPYARIAAALARPALDAQAAGRLQDRPLRTIAPELTAAVAPVAEALFGDLPTAKVVLFLEAWTALIGAISLELFGHWRNTVLVPELFFDETMQSLADQIGL
jgi:AcrR family transcriptional regulator